jgi:hypothetical protein
LPDVCLPLAVRHLLFTPSTGLAIQSAAIHWAGACPPSEHRPWHHPSSPEPPDVSLFLPESSRDPRDGASLLRPRTATKRSGCRAARRPVGAQKRSPRAQDSQEARREVFRVGLSLGRCRVAGCLDKPLKLFVRDFGFVHPEPIDGDSVHRLFVALAILRAHPISTARNPDHAFC